MALEIIGEVLTDVSAGMFEKQVYPFLALIAEKGFQIGNQTVAYTSKMLKLHVVKLINRTFGNGKFGPTPFINSKIGVILYE